MKTSRKLLLLLTAVAGGCFTACTGTPPPSPYGELPSEYQIEWQQLDYYMFAHFGPNTFTNVEWGDGKEDPKVFNPTNLDCRQWAATAKAAGMKGIIITAKHHDGFCLWPSNYSTHTVRESAWKDGKGDVLRELSDACKEYGLQFGVYLSPWDQNHPSYGTPEYNEVFVNTLTEVLTGYGHVFEQWFDGANGDAHKGKTQVYDWPLFHSTVYKHQPHAIIFSDVGPGCRWMGNESGVAGETNWSTLNITGYEPGLKSPHVDVLNTGNMNGEKWVPGETNVSIRPGWFYSPETDDKVKSVDELVDIFYTSIGRNTNLLLNVPPDRNGRIHPNDSTRLMEFRQAIEESFKTNLAKQAGLKASNTRGNDKEYGVENILHADESRYWAADDEVTDVTIDITLPQAETFNRFLVQEYIPLGQRVKAFTLEAANEETGAWSVIAEGTTIGYRRILRFPTTTAKNLRLHIKDALACPILNGLGLFLTPESFGGGSTAKSGSEYEKLSATLVAPEVAHGELIFDANARTVLTIDKMEPIIVKLPQPTTINGIVYGPEQDNKVSNIAKYNLYVSTDGKNWITVKENGVFHNIKNNPIPQTVKLDAPQDVQYIKLQPLETTNNTTDYRIADINVVK